MDDNASSNEKVWVLRKQTGLTKFAVVARKSPDMDLANWSQRSIS